MTATVFHDNIDKQRLSELEFNYELFYEDFYCDKFKSLSAAIKRAKESVKHNPDCKGGYNIRLGTFIIAVY